MSSSKFKFFLRVFVFCFVIQSILNGYEAKASCLGDYEFYLKKKHKNLRVFSALANTSIFYLPFYYVKKKNFQQALKAKNLLDQAYVGSGPDLEKAVEEINRKEKSIFNFGYSKISDHEDRSLSGSEIAAAIVRADRDHFFCLDGKVKKYAQIIETFRNDRIFEFIELANSVVKFD